MKDTQFVANSNIEICRIVEEQNIFVVDAQIGANANVASIRVRTSSGTAYSSYTDVRIYVNGKLDSSVDGVGTGVTPTGESTKIRYNQWNILSLVFDPLLDFSGFSGHIDITGPFIINNVADYQIDKSREGDAIVFAQWGEGQYSLLEDVGSWSGVLALGNWREILEGIVLPISLGLDAQQLYGSYLGISKLGTLSSFESKHSMDVIQNATSAYLGIRSSVITATPL
jgi:hypothetical protein